MKKKSDSFRNYVLEQLGQEATCRALFGGYGIYRGDRIFGIVFKGRLYFTTSPRTRLARSRRRISGRLPVRPGHSGIVR